MKFLINLYAIFLLSLFLFPRNLAATCATGATINITEPVSGGIVYAGESFAIRWNGSLQGSSCLVTIAYQVDEGDWQLITSSTNDDGYYLWNVPSTINSTNIDLAISYITQNDSGTYTADFLNDFTVEPQTCSNGETITILEPDPNEVLTAGQSFNIQWTGSLQGSSCPIQILYQVDEGAWVTIISSTPDDGLHVWNVPSNVNSTNVDVFVGYITPSNSGATIGTYANNLSVLQPDPPELEFSTCISSQNSIYENGDLSSTFSLRNIGESTWTGFINVAIVESTNLGNYQVIYNNSSVSISAGNTYNVNTGTDQINLSPGNYVILVNYNNSPIGNAYASQGTCTPILTYDNGQYTTHYKSVTINENIPPALEYSSCLNTTPIINENGVVNFNFSLRNIGTSAWSSNVIVSIMPAGGGTTSAIWYEARTMAPSSTQNFSSSWNSTVAPGDYWIFVSYNGGTNSSNLVQNNGCLPTFTISGQTTQYKLLTVNSQPIPPELQFAQTDCLSAPSSVNQGEGITVNARLKNIGTSTWSGDIAVYIGDVNDLSTVNDEIIYTAPSSSINANSELYFSTGNISTSNLPPGNYQIYVTYTNSPNVPSNLHDYPDDGTCTPSVETYEGYQTYVSNLTVLSSSGIDCSNLTDLTASGTDMEAHEATVCLCEHGYVSPQNHGSSNTNGVQPDLPIIRQDLAKLTFYALYRGDNACIADNFPVPFLDLQGGNTYYRYAKALSFLQYNDNTTPFDREFINFNPGASIERRYALKAFLEAFDIPPDYSDGGTIQGINPNEGSYGYVHKAWDLGIITSPSEDSHNALLRRDAFIMVQRILSLGSEGCTDCDGDCYPVPTDADFFQPVGNFTPYNLARAIGPSEGFFTHSPNGAFNISGINLPLVFAPSYNSYLTALPNAVTIQCPLGKGWTHPYNAYITKYDVDGVNKAMVFWSSGELHTYNLGTQAAETWGVFDDITEVSATEIRIVKKNQMVFTFSKYGSLDESPYLLTKIEDRNANAITIQMENATNSLINKRIDKVIGTPGRELNFYYQSGTDFISQVEDVAGGRNMYFNVDATMGNLTWYQNPKGNKEFYDYGLLTGEHLLHQITHPEGNISEIEYFPIINLLKKVTIMENGLEKYVMDVAVTRNMTTTNPYITSVVTDPTSTTNNEFNTDGFLKKSTTTNNGGADVFQDLTYGGTGDLRSLPTNLKSGSTAHNIDVDYEYFANGNLKKITLPDGTHHDFTYTALNDIATYTDPREYTTTYAYDENDNLDYVDDAMNFRTNYTINSQGLTTSISNPEGIAYSFDYDIHGSQTSVTAPLGINTTMTYDAIGRLTSTTNSEDQVTTYDSYDAHDMVLQVTQHGDPANIVTKYGYDKNDNLLYVEDAHENRTNFTYDDGDFMRTMTFGNDTKTYDYYKNGQVKSFQKPDGTVLNYQYDDLNRLTNDGYNTYNYFDDGMLEHVTHGSVTTAFTYDNQNRLETSTEAGETVTYNYDANGNRTRITYPSGLQVNYEYDANNRMTFVRWTISSTNYEVAYTYRKDGLLSTSIYPNGTLCEYNYDDAGRMTNLINRKTDGTIISSYTYTLDKLGNQTGEQRIEPFAMPTLADIDIAGQFNNENEAIAIGSASFSFDANGNQSTNGTQSSTWDDRDMMLSYGGNLYAYNGLGLRWAAATNEVNYSYVWDVQGMGNVLQEGYDGSVEHQYIHGLGLIARITQQTNAVHFYHYDYRGSTIAMTDANANITHQYAYDPYGKVTDEQEVDFNAFRYVGKYGVMYDGDDLYYMRARYYDADKGRFLSEDPVWGTNLYAYGDNNPVSKIDPEGELGHIATAFLVGGGIKGTFKIITNISTGEKWYSGVITSFVSGGVTASISLQFGSTAGNAAGAAVEGLFVGGSEYFSSGNVKEAAKKGGLAAGIAFAVGTLTGSDGYVKSAVKGGFTDLGFSVAYSNYATVGNGDMVSSELRKLQSTYMRYAYFYKDNKSELSAKKQQVLLRRMYRLKKDINVLSSF